MIFQAKQVRGAVFLDGSAASDYNNVYSKKETALRHASIVFSAARKAVSHHAPGTADRSGVPLHHPARRGPSVPARRIALRRTHAVSDEPVHRDLCDLRDGPYPRRHRDALGYVRPGRHSPAHSDRRSRLYDHRVSVFLRAPPQDRPAGAHGAGTGPRQRQLQRHREPCAQYPARHSCGRRGGGAHSVFPLPAGVRLRKGSVVRRVPLDLRVLQRGL